MPEPANAPAAPGRAESILIAVAGASFAALALIVSSATPIPAAFFHAAAFALALGGMASLAHRAMGPPAATLVRGAALAGATVLTRPGLSPGLDAAPIPAAVIIAGVTLLQASTRARRRALPLDAVGIALLLAGLGAGVIASAGAPEPWRLRAALIATGVVALLGIPARQALLRTRLAAQAPTPAGLVAATALLSVYVLYRPVVAERLGNLVLYEWGLAAALAGLVLARLRKAARRDEAPEAWRLDARRHAQDVRPLYDARMAPVAAVLQRYLERGEAFEEYVAALERGQGGPLPAHIGHRLEAARPTARATSRRGRAEAKAQRVAAHRAALEHIE